jgi:hypothetical protein
MKPPSRDAYVSQWGYGEKQLISISKVRSFTSICWSRADVQWPESLSAQHQPHLMLPNSTRPSQPPRQQLRWPCSGRVCTARYATVNAPRDRMSIINRVTTARCFSSLFTNHMTTPIHNCEPTSLTLQYPHLWHLIHSPAERQKRSSAGMTRRTRPRLAEELPTPVAHVAEP